MGRRYGGIPQPWGKATVTLSDEDWALAQELGLARFESNRASGVEDKRVSSGSTADHEASSLGAEIAVARALRVPFDDTIEPRAGGHDLEFRGWRIDVKQTKHKHGKLIAERHVTRDKADLYVLAVGEGPAYRLAGWTWAVHLIAEHMVDHGFKKPCYAMKQSELFLHRIPDFNEENDPLGWAPFCTEDQPWIGPWGPQREYTS